MLSNVSKTTLAKKKKKKVINNSLPNTRSLPTENADVTAFQIPNLNSIFPPYTGLINCGEFC